MEKNFEIKKRGKYIECSYLRYTPSNSAITLYNPNNIWHSNRSECEKFMKLLIDIEPIIDKILKEKGLSHDAKKIILFRIKTLDAISIGLDIRSSMSIEEIADMLVFWFNKKFVELKAKGEKILSGIKANPVGYYSNWREFDTYNTDNQIYELGLESLEEYFTKDPLLSMSESLDEVLELFKGLKSENLENKKD